MSDFQAIARSSSTATPHPAGPTCELIHLRDGRSDLNYAIYHDRHKRTPDGWKFTERVCEVRYLDGSPLAGSPPNPAQTFR